MSQRDLVAELRAARTEAPAELRERVRLIAAADTTPGAPPHVHLAPRARRRRAASRRPSPARSSLTPAGAPRGRRPPLARRATTAVARRRVGRRACKRPAPRPCRAASRPTPVDDARPALRRLRSRCACRRRTASPTGVKQALRITRSLGGYAGSVHATTAEHGRQRRPDAEDPAHARPGGDRAPLGARDDHRRAGRRPGPADRAQRDRPDDRAAPAAARRPARPAADRRRRRAHVAALTAQIQGLQRGRGGHGPRRRATPPSALHLGTAAPTPAPAPRTARCTASASRSAGSGSARSTCSRSARRCCSSLVARLARRPDDPPPPRGRAAQPFLICAKTRNVGSPTGSSPNSGLTQPSSSSSATRRCARSRPCTSAAAGAGRGSRRSPACASLGRPQHVQVDLDVVDLLHAADVGVAPRLVRVDEGAAARETGARIDDLVAVDLAAAALHLVLRMERQGRRGGGLLWRHACIVRAFTDGRKT